MRPGDYPYYDLGNELMPLAESISRGIHEPPEQCQQIAVVVIDFLRFYLNTRMYKESKESQEK